MREELLALRSELERVTALRFCGVWQTDLGDYALFEDAAGTRTSFMLKQGETLSEGLSRVAERYAPAGPPPLAKS
ncbi:hypothetical protein [Candidatus Nitrospira bockiana]